MQSQPSISIITVAKADPSGLVRTIKSITGVLSEEVESVIVSSGGNLVVLNETSWPKNYCRFYEAPDAGIFDAMNKGVLYSRGKYIVFLNCGDTYNSNFRLVVDLVVCADTNADFFYGAVNFFVRPDHYYIRDAVLNQSYISRFLSRMPIPHPALLVSRNAFDLLGLFNLKYPNTADHDWIVRLIDSGLNGRKIPFDFVTFELGGASSQFKVVLEKFRAGLDRRQGLLSIIASVIYGFLIVLWYKLIVRIKVR